MLEWTELSLVSRNFLLISYVVLMLFDVYEIYNIYIYIHIVRCDRTIDIDGGQQWQNKLNPLLYVSIYNFSAR